MLEPSVSFGCVWLIQMYISLVNDFERSLRRALYQANTTVLMTENGKRTRMHVHAFSANVSRYEAGRLLSLENRLYDVCSFRLGLSTRACGTVYICNTC